MDNISNFSKILMKGKELRNDLSIHTFEAFMSFLISISFFLFEYSGNFNNVILIAILGILALARIQQRNVHIQVMTNARDAIIQLSDIITNMNNKVHDNEKAQKKIRDDVNDTLNHIHSLFKGGK